MWEDLNYFLYCSDFMWKTAILFINVSQQETSHVKTRARPGFEPKAKIIPLDQRANAQTLLCNTRRPRQHVCALKTKNENTCPQVMLYMTLNTRARPGFEPGTSRTLSENHTPRPTSQWAKASSIQSASQLAFFPNQHK